MIIFKIVLFFIALVVVLYVANKIRFFLIDKGRKSETLSKSTLVEDLTKLNIPLNIIQSVLLKLQKISRPDFIVKSSDKLSEIYGLTEYADIQDLATEIASTCNKRELKVETKIETVKDLAIYINSLPDIHHS